MSNALAVNDDTFDTEVLKSATPVLVDFWAPWCAPCRAVAPTVDAIATEFAGRLKVVKLNTDESNRVAMQFGVTSIPTLMVFKDGTMVDRVLGNRPKADLVNLVNRHLS
jgi:thioredoxin 1